jgi:hypothetical protein
MVQIFNLLPLPSMKPRSVGLFATRALIEKRVPSMQEAAAVAASAVSGAVASVALVET